ncbi:LysM peptidoglycan-binding domain-containing protein [Peribacillus sp. SCS-37]|uniref:LysM peptidoglycan-binding domain-containing protein n=1 Tax=Paraperibacillus esterisolvens TaxID=3115296 RepID=UPI003905F628
MVTKKGLAASFLAASLLFTGSAALPSAQVSVSAAQLSKYQAELNTFSAHYAKIFRTVESYAKKVQNAKTEKEAMNLYDQYLTYFSGALDDDAKFNKYNADIQTMDEYIYNSLVEMYNFEIDTIDYLNGDISKAEHDKAYKAMTKYVDAQDASFKKAAAAYKAKHKVTFSKDMLYLLDQEEPAPAKTGTYTVKKGDNLYRIAIKYKTSVTALKKLNNLKTDALKAGQVLKVPVQAGKPVQQTAVYKVKSGDTLYSISKKVKMSVAELKKLNNMKSDRIYVGQTLKIKK